MFRVYMDVWIFVAVFLGSFAAGWIIATTRRGK